MLTVWNISAKSTTTSNHLGVFQETIPVNLPLPTLGDTSKVKFKVITGKLPNGLRLEGPNILGVPKEVARPTDFKFCVRASYNNSISDRTFVITIEGSDRPTFITPEGLLPAGPNQTFFILDRSPVEFQIKAEDFDIDAGQELTYFISSGDGKLPPGLTLNKNGLIHGLADPLFSVYIEDRTGGYDATNFDNYGFDFSIISSNGYDDFNFDSQTYDFSLPLRVPKKLNRNYEFIITVTDGETEPIKRKFRIYLVGEDFLKADNIIMRAGNNTYRADNTDVRAPIWLTPANLGIYRSNNFQIIKLDTIELRSYGNITYELEPKINKNDVNSPISRLPLGMELDSKTGELYGIIPYQADYSKTYTFTITATRTANDESSSVSKTFFVQILGEIDSKMSWVTNNNLGPLETNLISNLKIEAKSSLSRSKITYELINGKLPPGLTLNPIGEIIGKIRQYSGLGADNTIGTNDDILGLTTFNDIVNNQEIKNVVFDQASTSIDKEYKFIVRAFDQTYYSAIDREFRIEILSPDNKLFSNISVTSYMPLEKRESFSNFINNAAIFPQNLIYRPDDFNFGIRKDLRMLIFAGIETRNANEYVSMMGLNHKKKKFKFGKIQSAKAKIPGTETVVYEIIYIQMIDPQDFKNNRLPLNLTIDDFSRTNLDLKIKMNKANNLITADTSNFIWKTSEQEYYVKEKEPNLKRPYENITIDRTDIAVSDKKSVDRYPNTYSNWRKRIKNFKDLNGIKIENNAKYLPLWMRSFQDDRQEIGFTLALPICYCLPNTSSEILLNIKNSQFDFKLLDYTVDRYIIDNTNNYGQDRYYLFTNKEVVV